MAKKSSDEPSVLAAIIERVHDRLAKGREPSGNIIRQEAAQAKLSASMLEAMLRLDKRFAKTPAGWEIRSVGDRWPDLAHALPQSLAEGAESFDLFRQVIIEMNAATRAHFTDYYPNNFTLSEGLRKWIARLVESCPAAEVSRLKGPIFDLVMSELFDDASQNRFFTPRPITAMVAAWARPQPGERIVDPCYGSGGFLLAMAEWVQKILVQTGTVVEDHSTLFETTLHYVMNLGQDSDAGQRAVLEKMLHGIDHDPGAAWSGQTNLALHGFGGSYLRQANALDLAHMPFELESFDVVVGNPPFGDKITNSATLSQFELGQDARGHPLGQQTSEVLFIEAFLRLAKPGARLIVLVPDGVLANSGEQRVRDYLMRNAAIEAIIGLPRRVFRNDAKSNILLLRKKQAPDELQERPVFLAVVEDIWTELEEVLHYYSGGPKSL